MTQILEIPTLELLTIHPEELKVKKNYTGRDYLKIRIYARIQLPSDYGLWPAFWTYGDDWPKNGEIDIMEAKVDVPGMVPVPTQYQTNYFCGDDEGVENLPTGPELTAVQVTGVNLMDVNYHVFMVEWGSGALKFYFDNVLQHTQAASDPDGFWVPFLWLNTTQHIVLNLAYGGNFLDTYLQDGTVVEFVPGPELPTPEHITDGIMKVDWVKVFVKY